MKRPAAAKRTGAAAKRSGTAKRLKGRAKRPATTKRPGGARRSAAARKPAAKGPVRGKRKKPLASKRSAAAKSLTRKAAAKSPTRKAAAKSAGRKAVTRKPAGAKPSFPKAPKARPVRLKRAHIVRHGTRPAARPKDGRKSPAIRPPFEAYRGSKPYVFISYSHDNMRDVFNIIRKLNANRYRIWYDEGIEPGNEWPEEVGRAILNSSQFMVFMSPTAADSRNVRNEINLATSDAKSILVIYLQETDLSEGLRLQIGTVQNLNRYEMTEPEFLDKLKKVLSTELRS